LQFDASKSEFRAKLPAMTYFCDLVKQMSMEEKISWWSGMDLWHTQAMPRLGIPASKVTDGPNGARGAGADLGPASAPFPVGTALGAAWDPELIQRLGAELACAVSANRAHVLLAPMVNIHRTPVAARNFECYSEDPLLKGKIAAAVIRALQANGAAA
jgi:beta-glucosidase